MTCVFSSPLTMRRQQWHEGKKIARKVNIRQCTRERHKIRNGHRYRTADIMRLSSYHPVLRSALPDVGTHDPRIREIVAEPLRRGPNVAGHGRAP